MIIRILVNNLKYISSSFFVYPLKIGDPVVDYIAQRVDLPLMLAYVFGSIQIGYYIIDHFVVCWAAMWAVKW